MIHFLIVLVLALAITGLATSTVFALLAAVSALAFTRSRRERARRGFLPPLSLLKPLHGAEPEMEQHLRTFFEQDYPEFEILFCARSEDDPALAVARRVARSYPKISACFLSSGEPQYPNAKVWSLERMGYKAAHEILVISDSDVSVAPDYLRSVVAPFADDRVGLVTCLYRGISRGPSYGGSFWSRLEAVGMSFEMSAGVLVAWLLEGMKFALGPTMAVRASVVRRFGGFRALGRYHADDFMLGNLVSAAGYEVVLSRYVVAHHILNEGLVSSTRHQIRWMRSTRFSRPKGHLGTALTFSMPYAILGGVAALVAHRGELAALLFVWGWFTRVVLGASLAAVLAGSAKVVPGAKPGLLESILLYPLRDLCGFLYWAASYLSRGVEWRGDEYQLLENGAMLSRRRSSTASNASPVFTSAPEDPELAAVD